MAFTFFNNREPRQFNYKPRFYDPKKEESTGDARRDFARNLHDEWQSKRNHTADRKNNFSITIRDRIIEGKARSKTVAIINEFIDGHEAELMELWGRAQRGEKITKIK